MAQLFKQAWLSILFTARRPPDAGASRNRPKTLLLLCSSPQEAHRRFWNTPDPRRRRTVPPSPPRHGRPRRGETNQREHYKRKGRSQKLYHHYPPAAAHARLKDSFSQHQRQQRSPLRRQSWEGNMAKEGGGPDWNGLLKWSLAHGSDGTNPPRALRSVRPPRSPPPNPRFFRAPRT